MEVDGYCRKCSHSFDAHWHHFPKGVICPRCGASRADIKITTDESNDLPEEAYEDEDREQDSD